MRGAAVFSDPLARIFSDVEHSGDETREIIIGHSSTEHLLLVYFTEIDDQTVRIFSARLATRREQRDYEANTCDKGEVKTGSGTRI